MSPSRGLAVVDAGTKAVSLDSGPPVLPPEATAGVQMEFVSGGDEHGKLLWPQVRRLDERDADCSPYHVSADPGEMGLPWPKHRRWEGMCGRAKQVGGGPRSP